MSVKDIDMPILKGHSRTLSPLADDEDTSDVSTPPALKGMKSPGNSEDDEAMKSTILEIASVIMTTRPCGWSVCSGQDSRHFTPGSPVAVGLSQEVHSRMLAQVESTCTAYCSVCIEVHGHACEIERGGASSRDLSSASLHTPAHSTGPTLTGCSVLESPSRPSMILEVWSIQVINMTSRCVDTSSRPASSTTATTPSIPKTTPTSKATPRSGATPTPCVAPVATPLLIQAVQSHLHFSQIRSWQEMGMCSHTHPLFQLVYRVRSGVDAATIFDDAASEPHTFPLTPLHGTKYLQVIVWSLPRLNSIPQQLYSQSTNSSVPPQLQYQSKISSIPQQLHSQSTISSVPVYTQQFHSHSTVSSVPQHFPGRKSHVLNSLKPSSESMQEPFPFSPPTPSPLSPKLLAGLTDKLHTDLSVPDMLSSPTPSATRSGTRRPIVSACADRVCDVKYSDAMSCNKETLYQDICTVTQPETVATSLGSANTITDELSSLQLDVTNSCGESNGLAEKTLFESAPRAPGSPAPFSVAYNGSKSEKRRSCALTCKRQPPSSGAKRVQRCNSAPVSVSSLCLLGTFEESILNGRLEACGHVDGFVAELAASGSFCPPHLTLPVTAAFYSLHDNYRGTSPYLGQVDLSEVGKRGYQVPRRGTVQVTLFNPNHTVVKIYIVPYDFSDMPPCSQTFLRQKTLSYPWSTVSSTSSGHQEGRGTSASFPSLHYLIHLRFLCSRSKRIYLHRDIRMLFARRAPDTEPGDSHVTLHTVTDGPEEPKYSPSGPV